MTTPVSDASSILTDQICYVSALHMRITTTGHADSNTARHMARHAKRDEEAGGPGLGILETRKRTRRTPNGTIVTRPAKRQARKAVPDRRDCSSSCASVDGSQEQSHRSPGSDNFPHGAPVSPPQSAPLDGHDQYSDQELDESDSLLAPMMPGGPYEPYVEPIPGQFDAADGSWGASTQFEMTEDSFGIDTGMHIRVFWVS